MLGKPHGIIKCDQASSPPTIRNTQDSNTNPPKLKKKVQLNKTIQFMDEDGSCDMVLAGSPDLEKLGSDDDYVGNGDSDNENDSDQSIQDGDRVEDTNTDEDESDYVDKDESSDEGEGDMELDEDDFGPLQYRDPKDKEFLLGFELRHFELDNDSGLDNINLRHEETTQEDTTLNDNLAFGLVNALLNSSDKADKRKGKKLLKKLKGNTPKTEYKSSNKKQTPSKSSRDNTNKSAKSIKVGQKKLKRTSKTTSRPDQSEKLRKFIHYTVKQLEG